MKKKIVFVLVMLIALTTSLSAQAVVSRFSYNANLSENRFIEIVNEMQIDQRAMMPITKLPNPVIQGIDKNLRDYSLAVGDIFLTTIIYQGINYFIMLRITEVKKPMWQFFAWGVRE